MVNKTIGKGLLVALLGLGAFGLLAGPPVGEHIVNIPFPERAEAPSDELEAPASPRECDLQRNIVTHCTFV